jgi:hypothetical protein
VDDLQPGGPGQRLQLKEAAEVAHCGLLCLSHLHIHDCWLDALDVEVACLVLLLGDLVEVDLHADMPK